MSPNELYALLTPYLDRVCRHLLWPPYRKRVRQELTDHIRSRTNELRCCAGLTEEQAIRRVLRALGNPDELGRSLRRARLPAPRIAYNALSAALWLAILACIVFLAIRLL